MDNEKNQSFSNSTSQENGDKYLKEKVMFNFEECLKGKSCIVYMSCLKDGDSLQHYQMIKKGFNKADLEICFGEYKKLGDEYFVKQELENK